MGKDKLKNNPVDHPAHYTSHPSGIEAIELCGEMDFCLGNAFKYLFRMENKWNPLEDLKKARWYIDRKAFQEKLCIKTPLKEEPCWNEIVRLIEDFEEIDSPILRVVQPVIDSVPQNIEKALLYIYFAATYESWGVEDSLQCARYYINREIKKRARKPLSKKK